MKDITMAAADSPDGSHGVGRRVFVSYTHDDERHKEDVRAFAHFLIARGIEVELDIWHTHTRQDWMAWATGHITACDYVLVIASAGYREVGDGGATDLRRGLQHEAAVLRELLYRQRTAWLPKLLPIVLPGHTLDELPLFLQPYSATHFLVDSIDDAGLDELLRVLTGQPRDIPRPTGPVPVLPPRALD